MALRDVALIAGGAVLVFLTSAEFDLFNRVISWIYRHDTWQLDEAFTVAVYLVIAISIYAWRRHNDLVRQVRQREEAEAEKARLMPELEKALSDVSALRMLLPMCSSCKRIRDSGGHWYLVEAYIESHLHAKIDDGLCPDCARKRYR